MSASDDKTSSLLKGLASVFERLKATSRSSFKLRATSVTATSVTIKVNGVEQILSGQAGLESLRQIASQAGIEVDEVLGLISSSGTLTHSQQVAQSGRVERVLGPVSMTLCNKCHRKVPESAKCLYCGQVLESQVGKSQAENDVDKKFLETNVVEEGHTEAKQQLHDTYEDRLKNL